VGHFRPRRDIVRGIEVVKRVSDEIWMRAWWYEGLFVMPETWW